MDLLSLKKETYKNRDIVINEDKGNTRLSIDGKDINHTAEGGRYWSRHTPYVDYPSLIALAKSIIDQGRVKKISHSKKISS